MGEVGCHIAINVETGYLMIQNFALGVEQGWTQGTRIQHQPRELEAPIHNLKRLSRFLEANIDESQIIAGLPF